MQQVTFSYHVSAKIDFLIVNISFYLTIIIILLITVVVCCKPIFISEFLEITPARKPKIFLQKLLKLKDL